MSTDESVREVESAEERATSASGTDGFFGFVVGLYAAALAAPMLAIWVALWVSTDPGVLFFVLLGTVVVVTSGVGWVARRESLAVRLGASRWVWAAVVLPFCYFGVLVAAAGRPGDSPSAVGGIAILGAVAGFVVGIGLVASAHNRRAKATLADAEVLARLTAPAPERDRRIATRVVVGLFVVGALGFAGSVLLDFPPLRWLFQLVVPTGAALYGTTSPREVTISDGGLVVGNPAYKRFRPWSAYESYAVTEEAIVVRWAGRSPWGLRDLRRDPADVDDVAAVASALETVLPRDERRRS